MHPRIEMFLRERDRARLRGDNGVIRSLTADLRRLGVPDTATLADPTGRSSGNGKRGPGRPRKPRCEHGSIVDHCLECAEDRDSVTALVPTIGRFEQQLEA